MKWLSLALLAGLGLAVALFVNVCFFKPVAIDAFYGRAILPSSTNEVLIHGSLPLVVLERVIDEWIEQRHAN